MADKNTGNFANRPKEEAEGMAKKGEQEAHSMAKKGEQEAHSMAKKGEQESHSGGLGGMESDKQRETSSGGGQASAGKEAGAKDGSK